MPNRLAGKCIGNIVLPALVPVLAMEHQTQTQCGNALSHHVYRGQKLVIPKLISYISAGLLEIVWPSSDIYTTKYLENCQCCLPVYMEILLSFAVCGYILSPKWSVCCWATMPQKRLTVWQFTIRTPLPVIRFEPPKSPSMILCWTPVGVVRGSLLHLLFCFSSVWHIF